MPQKNLESRVEGQRYPPIADYALIGDCHSAALVSRSGSIDWCCLPRFDSDSVFGRLLDWDKGGHLSVTPVGAYTVRREYLDRSLVLATTVASIAGEMRLLDFFAMRSGGRTHPRRELVRLLEGIRGRMRLTVQVSPRFDFGEVKPWIFRRTDGAYAAVGSNKALLIFGNIDLQLDGEHDLRASIEIGAGERRHLGLRFVAPEHVDEAPSPTYATAELDAHLEETQQWWRAWAEKLRTPAVHGAAVVRSAIVLKALSHAPTGAIVAAVTTSLPERIGGERNWDYRYSWLRDSIFTVHSLGTLGCAAEADGFRRFVQRSAAGNADELQVLYGVDGKRRQVEVDLNPLQGWRGSRPVRVGNAAYRQFQLDMFGLLLELAWRWSSRGNSPDPQYWSFLVEIVEATIGRWAEPDRGFWEIRGPPRHFVHSKVMCWAALNRGVQLARRHGLRAPLERWTKVRDDIRAAVELHGVDRQRDVFVESFGSTATDAALLLLPDVEFVAYDDPRMIRTTDLIRRELEHDGLLLRYRTDDGLTGTEGVFLACSFWLAECLARQGRLEEAVEVFDRAAGCANDLGLFSEEFEPGGGELLGNFPQGLTHLAHIAAALAVEGARASRADRKE